MHIQIGFQTIVGHLIASIQIVLLTVASQWGDDGFSNYHPFIDKQSIPMQRGPFKYYVRLFT